jgi:hypothetical protein
MQVGVETVLAQEGSAVDFLCLQLRIVLTMLFNVIF